MLLERCPNDDCYTAMPLRQSERAKVTDPPPIVQSWDRYWQGTRHGSAYSSGGTSHPVVLSFWDNFFKGVQDARDQLKIIDIASGGGAVVESAKTAFGGQLPDFTCVDISDSAINALNQRFPGVNGIVADARAIPLRSGGYDIATSQFGIEYAGIGAMEELMRLVAPGGQLAVLLHHREGGIFRQCSASLDAVRTMTEAKFLPYAITMFKEGFEVCRGADKHDFDTAAKQFIPAIRTMESIMRQHGRHVADGTILQLYQDIRNMHDRMQHYEPAEVLNWLDRMQGEIEAFAGRMASMRDAAVDAEAFAELCEKLENQGFGISRREPLVVPERNVPLAWALIARRD